MIMLVFGKITAIKYLGTLEHLNGCTQAHNYARKL